MDIWIFNHHAQGPELPGGTRHYDLAKQLTLKGHDVTIFAAGFHYTLMEETVKYDNVGYKIEDKNSVKFVWVETYPYEKNNTKRMINIVSYAWKLYFLIPKLNLTNPDIIIGTTVHPFAPIVGYRFTKKYKTPFIFEIRDLWPQSFIDMGVWQKNSLVSKIFKSIESFTVKRADSIISLSPKTEQYLKDEYGYEKNIYIPNSVDIESADKNKNIPSMNTTFEELQKLKTDGKKLFMFTGAIVQSNSINMFIETARKLKINDVQIIIVGKGQERAKYEEIAQKESLKNILFLDPVEKKLVPKLLNYADVLLLIQGNVQWGSSNKLYDYLAAKKPIITSLYVKHNDVVEDIKCGYSARYDSSDDMVEKIEKVYNLSQTEKEKMGNNAYEYVRINHNIKLMADKLEKLCKDLVQNA
jgi:glycosyltransferase involved in cell wall biosynthesis